MIRSEQEGQPWWTWPLNFGMLNLGPLNKVRQRAADAMAIREVLAFSSIINGSDSHLSEAQGILLFGDLPIYVS